MKLKFWQHWTFKAIAVGIAAYGSWQLYEEITGDFRLTNITFEMPYHPEWEMPALSQHQQQQVDNILNQHFTYLGKGHQTFVFASQDGKYVLKFFRFKRLKPSLTIDTLSNVPGIGSYFAHLEQKRQHRLQKLFEGYRVGYKYDQDNTGLIFIHLNPTNIIKKEVVVTDWMGFRHVINLDSVVFAIQKRGRMTKDVLMEQLANRNIDGIVHHLQQLIDMYHAEYKKGIIDQDHNILHNTGFAENKPMRLDIGQLQYDERVRDPAIYSKDLNKIIDKRIIEWLERNSPSQASLIINRININ